MVNIPLKQVALCAIYYSMNKQPTYRDFFKRFPDDETCLEHLKKVRYGDKHKCEKCSKQAKFYRTKKRRSYSCEHCGHHIYPMAGTPFQRTRTSLQDWFFCDAPILLST